MFFFFFFRPLVAVTSHVIHKIVFHSLFFSYHTCIFLLAADYINYNTHRL